MSEEIAFEMDGFPIFKGSWPWPWSWIGSYCIQSCITRRHLHTCQISIKSKKLFVDGRTYGRTDIWDHSVRSTQKRRSKKKIFNTKLHVARTFVRQLFCTWLVLITCDGDFSHQIQATELCDVSRCKDHVRKAESECSDVMLQQFSRSVV